jgi:site-specific recombinase XerC
VELVEQFCTHQLNLRGRTPGGVRTYRWNLEQFLAFVRKAEGRLARVGNLNAETIQAWMDAMSGADLAASSMRVRQSALSSLCSSLVKRNLLSANPVAKLDRPQHRREAPRQVPGSDIMDRLIKAARDRKRPRDLAILLILRYPGMRRESVARLCVKNVAGEMAAKCTREGR